MNENYTQNAQNALVDAQDMAVALNNTEVKPEHLHLENRDTNVWISRSPRLDLG